MAVVVSAPPALLAELALFHTTDPLLSNSPVLVFHGAAASIGATSSRIQVHVFTPAGCASYARLAVSPTSPFYSAVSNLPREEQGDEVCRGLAFGLKKYFVELPEAVKKAWCTHTKAPSPSALFGDDHIAILASRMTRIENFGEVVSALTDAYAEQRQSWQDVDIILPPGAIKETSNRADSLGSSEGSDAKSLSAHYGRYAELISSFGDVTFMPTPKLKRAPSKPTTAGRGTSFLKHQKENARKELCELLDTEESYVEHIEELKNLSGTLEANSQEASRLRLCNIFPSTINDILHVNAKFLVALRQVVESTEQSALRDFEAMSEGQPATAHQVRQDFASDPQGIVAFSKCLCEWFPHLSDAYSGYLKTYANAAQSLRGLLRSSDTALATALQDIGEQKLTSRLIEPVQRLPRYTLYIDSIVKQLPVGHPATKYLLKARDTIAGICEQDATDSGVAQILSKLRDRCLAWPSDVEIGGRLVTIIDYEDLAAPYSLKGCDAGPGLLLLFTDGLIFLEKTSADSISARTLLTELESSLMISMNDQKDDAAQDLRFSRRVHLAALSCSESQGGRILQLFTHFGLDAGARPAHEPITDSCQVLRLEAMYDGKAARFVEELTKAKIEGRFGDAERESAKWQARASDAAADHASLLSAVFEDSSPEHVASRRGCAPVRVIVDIDKHSQRPRAGHGGIRTIVAVSPSRDGLWRMTIDSVDGAASREYIVAADFGAVLSKRLVPLSAAQFAIDKPSMTSCLLQKNVDVLTSIELQVTPEEGADKHDVSPERIHRPRSPRKLLSNFLSSTGPGTQLPALLKKDLPALPPQARPQSMFLPSVIAPVSKPPSRESRPSSKDQGTPLPIASMESTGHLANTHRKLEETLSTYMLALQARKGNIVGRSLKMRATADELAVNELYNQLLEDPNMVVLAAQATVDVLFAAFEKFLNVAWKEQVGQVVPFALLNEIQSRAETMFPADFDAYFRSALTKLPPQNQRAFKGIMKLLADLLDGTGNDGDRGILTAAFAEVLVTEGNPHEFIALIDRFVDDTETYFGEPLSDAQTSNDLSASAHKRARSVNSASISSNTSSLRKKFGFSTLSRENSKSEPESKVASLLRTLSKSTRSDASLGSSITRATLNRSQSTDTDVRGLPSRPSSQDGPVHGKSVLGEQASSVGASSTHNSGLTTIGEHPSFIPTGPPRKKRRSSLSDLKVLDATQQKSLLWSSPSPRRPPVTGKGFEDKSLPNSPMPSTPSSKGGSGRFDSPTREPPRSRLPSSFRNENSPGAKKAYGSTEQRPRSSSNKPDEVVITARPTSSIPTLAPKTGSPQRAVSPVLQRSGLAERPGAGNIVKRPSPQAEKMDKPATAASTDNASPKKLRMQSPQKLRERLQNQQSAITAAQNSLQDELSKIGDELTATPSRVNSVRTPETTGIRTNGVQQPRIMDLAQRVLKMEGQLPKHVDELNAHVRDIQTDLASSVLVLEHKCKKLDELYREANGENEALYTRFNDELGRILKAVKSGEGADELKRKLKESQEEVAKLRRETSRLKRENVGFRAQLKE